MRHLKILLLLAGVYASVHAAPEMACMQDCFSRGYDQTRCITICDGGQPAPGYRGNRTTPGQGYQGGMMNQQGLPPNPAFDQMQGNVQPQRRLPAITDQNCMKDCQKRNYNYMLCQQQCSYTGYGQ